MVGSVPHVPRETLALNLLRIARFARARTAYASAFCLALSASALISATMVVMRVRACWLFSFKLVRYTSTSIVNPSRTICPISLEAGQRSGSRLRRFGHRLVRARSSFSANSRLQPAELVNSARMPGFSCRSASRSDCTAAIRQAIAAVFKPSSERLISGTAAILRAGRTFRPISAAHARTLDVERCCHTELARVRAG
jgi:hypothetical protein